MDYLNTLTNIIPYSSLLVSNHKTHLMYVYSITEFDGSISGLDYVVIEILGSLSEPINAIIFTGIHEWSILFTYLFI